MGTSAHGHLTLMSRYFHPWVLSIGDPISRGWGMGMILQLWVARLILNTIFLHVNIKCPTGARSSRVEMPDGLLDRINPDGSRHGSSRDRESKMHPMWVMG